MTEWGTYLKPHGGGEVRSEERVGGKLLESLRPLVTCPECGGDGKERSNFGAFGVGRSAVHPCPTCHGTGKVKDPSVGPEEVADRVLRLVELCAFEGPPTLVAHHINEVLAGLSIPSEEPS